MISYEQLLGHLADCHCVPNPDVHVEGGEMYYNLNEGMVTERITKELNSQPRR